MIKLPEEFINRMKEELPGDYEAFLNSYEQSSYHALRVNTLKCDTDFFLSFFGRKEDKAARSQENAHFSLETVTWEEGGFYYAESDEPGRLPYHDAGLYYIQEPSAMLPVGLLAVDDSGQSVLDLCAAPGGKSFQIAARMKGKGILISNEIHPGRAAVLSENMERMGVRNACVCQEKPDRLAERFPCSFDRILVDAPCSGEGMFRKNPEAVTQWSTENVSFCAARQKELLNRADQMLKPGGILVYSTCTFSRQENEEVVAYFLQTHPDYLLTKEQRLYPHQIRGEGHFAACFEKRKAGVSVLEKPGFPGKRSVSLRLSDCDDLMRFQEETLSPSADLFLTEDSLNGRMLIRFGDALYLAPKDTPALNGLRVLRPGLMLGKSLKNRFEPAHALALSLRPDDVKRHMTLSLKKAYDYRKGLTFPCEGENGWTLITVDGFSLGFGKSVQGMMKNHYPKGLRK
ncbi:MAG: RsmF rRNA methyltransferase first C-terminal domain-containing protein [Lachnospiraceae bacterium]|nr:RsmF rRNA methyltransferase first C-terminal domain-containing protein [Lachnospiraceae bacterium]